MSGKGVTFMNGHITERAKDRRNHGCRGTRRWVEDSWGSSDAPGRVLRSNVLLAEPIDVFTDRDLARITIVDAGTPGYSSMGIGRAVRKVGGRSRAVTSTVLDGFAATFAGTWGDPARTTLRI
jgi:hypothetical protein